MLLDEITVDLDVVARMDLLGFLKEECEEVDFKFCWDLYIELHLKTH